MKVIAVVVTYNRKELLSECLNSILAQTFPVSKIIVINNASTDGTEELFKYGNMFDIPQIQCLNMTDNLGGAGGFYEGIKAAKKEICDWVWIMDDDTIPLENSLEELLLAQSCVKREVSFLASSVRGAAGEPMNVPMIQKKVSLNGYADWHEKLEYGMVKIASATFVSILINYDAILTVGLPYKEYFIWGDDTEYTLRLTKYYGDAFMCGKSKVIHKRANAKSLSIINEHDEKRMKLYYYYYRNKLINAWEYKYKMTDFIRTFLNVEFMSVSLLFKRNINHRLKKFFIVQKGIVAFIFRQYDYTKFKERIGNCE